MVDADGATEFTEIDKVLNKLKEIETDGKGMAIGSRNHLVTEEVVMQRKWYRNLLMHAMHFIVMSVIGVPIRDT